MSLLNVLSFQARSKKKMTGGGGGALSEKPTLIPPSPGLPPSSFRSLAGLKHTTWYMSDHYSCVQYLLFCL